MRFNSVAISVPHAYSAAHSNRYSLDSKQWARSREQVRTDVTAAINTSRNIGYIDITCICMHGFAIDFSFSLAYITYIIFADERRRRRRGVDAENNDTVSPELR